MSEVKRVLFTNTALRELKDGDDAIEVMHIDARPAGYALRILQAYLNRESYEITDRTDGEATSDPLFMTMNEQQAERRKDLERAISILKEATYE